MKDDFGFKTYNKIFFSFLFILILYSFDYSLGWGLNLMFPSTYFFTLGTGNNGYNSFIWNENGLIEYFQIILTIFTLIVLLRIILTYKYSNLIKILIFFQFFGLAYITIEEISWGQHLIKFNSPDLFLDEGSIFYNKQGEFNFHNTSNLFNEIPRALILLWCTLSIPIIKLINEKNKSDLILFIKPNDKLLNLGLLILFLSLPDLIINKLELIDNSKLFIFNYNGFERYDLFQFFLNAISLNFIRFSELQEILIYNYFLWHSLFLAKTLVKKSN